MPTSFDRSHRSDKIAPVTENEIIDFVSGLPGVVAETACQATGAPEVAWGDSFFVYDPDRDVGGGRRFSPFATIVTKDYEGFDTASKLSRPGVFRLNIAVGCTRLVELLGHPPQAHQGHFADLDYTVADQLLPHPAYASQGWVSILNPNDRTSDQVRSLLVEAHARAAKAKRREPPQP